MPLFVKRLVSKKKRRFQRDGFDLDLTYVTPRLIAMGFPSEGREAAYRNSITSVKQFLYHYHPDSFRVYNLCSERGYESSKFDGRVAKFCFDDHNPPPMTLFSSFFEDMDEHFQNGGDVAAIHCKAGKGRTGVMICAYLLHSGEYEDAKTCLEYYGAARTIDGKGVTIPSQRRYIHYVERYIYKMNRIIPPRTLLFRSITIANTPKLQNAFIPSFSVYRGKTRIFKSQPLTSAVKPGKSVTLEMPPLPVCEDIKVVVFTNKKEKVFHLWFHTSFVENLELVIPKLELDGKPSKDKNNKMFPKNMTVTLSFEDSEMLSPLDIKDNNEGEENLDSSGDDTDAEDLEFEDGAMFVEAGGSGSRRGSLAAKN